MPFVDRIYHNVQQNYQAHFILQLLEQILFKQKKE